MGAIKKFIKKKILRNMVQQGLKGAVSFVGASQLKEWGIEFDLVLMTAAIMGLIEFGWEWLKQKTGWKWL